MRVLVGFDGSDGSRDAIALARVLCRSDRDEVLPVEADAGDSPARAIADMALEKGADLIVVGSPHRGALGRTFVGSVAESLLHGATTPIAVAPRGYAAGPHAGLGVIAVAYDGGEEAKLALAHAAALAAAAAARLRVLSVSSSAVPMPAFTTYTPALGFDVDALLAEALAAVDPAIEAEAECLAGPIASAIADACAEDVDLLVAGSRGYGPLGRVFAGSVTSSLICRSPCPVIVLPRTRVARERRGEAPPTSARAAKEANVREYLRGRRALAPHRTGSGEARSVSR